MAEYHVGCGAFGIYAGTLNKKGTMWQNKTDVTKEAAGAVAQHLLENKSCMTFDYKGKRYRLQVVECEAEE